MSNEFYNERWVRKTRKNHRCEICDSVISIGSKAIYASGKTDGNVWGCYMHEVCKDIYDEERNNEELPFNGTFENIASWGISEKDRLEIMKNIPNPSKYLLDAIDIFEEILEERTKI